MGYADPDKQREYQRAWRQRRRDQYMADKACIACGTTDALDVHHVDPDQKIDHNVWSWKAERREAELAKCVVLCRPCHNEIHHPALRALPHGTHSGYSYHGCRCDDCKAAHAAYGRQRAAVAKS